MKQTKANVVAFGGDNRHPVDELIEVRAKLKALQEREEELRQQILDGTCTLQGDFHVARIREAKVTYVKQQELIEHFGRITLAPFLDDRIIARIFLRLRVK
jgi:hypothetical protein